MDGDIKETTYDMEELRDVVKVDSKKLRKGLRERKKKTRNQTRISYIVEKS